MVTLIQTTPEKQICYLVGAGESYNMPFSPNPNDFVIAADGGLSYLKKYKIKVDLIIGDFDSLSEKLTADECTIVLPQEKDDTDMICAMREGFARGFKTFHIYGGAGGRLDHTLANIQLLADIAQKNCRGFLFDEDTIITAVHNSKIKFTAESKGTVSVFSHSDISTGVYENGLKYSLNDATLHNTYPVGISNEFIGTPSEISVQFGTLIIIYPQNVNAI